MPCCTPPSSGCAAPVLCPRGFVDVKIRLTRHDPAKCLHCGKRHEFIRAIYPAARFGPVRVDKIREGRWCLFSEAPVTSDIGTDSRIRLAIMSLLYVIRRNNPSEPGMGSAELERVLGCPEPVIRFHVWYLRENNYITRLETGYFAITAAGVDRAVELGGPASSGPQLLTQGGRHTPRSMAALQA